MARRKKAAEPAQAMAESTPESTLTASPPAEVPTDMPIALEPLRAAARQAATQPPVYATDPHTKISVSLSDYSGGPAMHLLRSHRFKQMQIRFDREQPDERFLAMLRQAGWKDRIQEEGVYTKQIDPDARWQSVRQMEQEFKAVANAIRQSKRMEPALSGLAL